MDDPRYLKTQSEARERIEETEAQMAEYEKEKEQLEDEVQQLETQLDGEAGQDATHKADIEKIIGEKTYLRDSLEKSIDRLTDLLQTLERLASELPE